MAPAAANERALVLLLPLLLTACHAWLLPVSKLIIVYGATGFCGRLVCEYLHSRYAKTPTELRWAVAGRSEPRLRSLKHDLGLQDATPYVVADSMDAAAMAALAQATDVVITTAGPYAAHGSGLVAACAHARTHLVDLTGESYWVQEMIQQHHDTAAATGARIIPSCGFESIPADLGAFLAAQELRQTHGTAPDKISYKFGKFGLGGVSGGTFAAALSVGKALWEDETIAGKLADPYLLWPEGVPRPEARSPRSGGGFSYDATEGVWTAPYPFAIHDSKMVHRSGALLGYGAARYREGFVFEGLLAGVLPAVLVTMSLALTNLLFILPFTREALRGVGPKPGEGPSADIMENSFFEISVEATGENGARVRATVASDQGDPGYRETAKMCAECALALALDADTLPARAGVLTPATALGMVLVDRLRAAGMTLSLETLAAALPSGGE